MSCLIRSRQVSYISRVGQPRSAVHIRPASVSPQGQDPATPAGQKVSENAAPTTSSTKAAADQSSAGTANMGSSSTGSGSAGSSGSSGSPPPPDPYVTSILRRYKVLFVGLAALAGVSFVVPQYMAMQRSIDVISKRRSDKQKRSEDITAMVADEIKEMQSVAKKAVSPTAEEMNSMLQSMTLVTVAAADGDAAVSSNSFGSETSFTLERASSDGDAGGVGQRQRNDDAVESDKSSGGYLLSEAAPSAAESSTMLSSAAVAQSGNAVALPASSTDHSAMSEAELADLALQLKEKVENSKKDALQNVETSLDNVMQAISMSSELYKHATDNIKKQIAGNFTAIEHLAEGNGRAVEQAKRELAELDTWLQECTAKVNELARKLSGSIAVLDQAISEVQALGHVSSANSASQGASQALKSLHTEAEQMAQAHAELAVMKEYHRQVQNRVERHRSHMAELETAQEDMIRKTSERISSDDESTDDVDQQLSQQSLYNSEVQNLLSYAQQRVNVMEQRMSSSQQRQAKDITTLLEQQREEDSRVMQLKLDHLRHEMERQHAEELQAKDVEARYRLEEELKVQMKRQAAAHTEHLHASLQSQADQLTDDWRLELDLELRAAAAYHEKAMVNLTGEVEYTNQALCDTAKAIHTVHVSHTLWQTGSTVSDVLTNAPSCPPLRPFVDALQEKASQDGIIAAAIESMPRPALDAAIQSEATLRQRFATLRRNCQQVALLPADGRNGLWLYAMSYVRSLFVFQRRRVTCDGVDITNLDTFDLFALCEKQLQAGNFEAAVRVLNQLKGQPRVVAQDWLDRARVLLETRQAVDVILCQLLSKGLPSSTAV